MYNLAEFSGGPGGGLRRLVLQEGTVRIRSFPAAGRMALRDSGATGRGR